MLLYRHGVACSVCTYMTCGVRQSLHVVFRYRAAITCMTAVCLQSNANVAVKDASLCQVAQPSSYCMLRSISFCMYYVATTWCKTAVCNQEQTSLSLPSQSTATCCCAKYVVPPQRFSSQCKCPGIQRVLALPDDWPGCVCCQPETAALCYRILQ